MVAAIVATVRGEPTSSRESRLRAVVSAHAAGLLVGAFLLAIVVAAVGDLLDARKPWMVASVGAAAGIWAASSLLGRPLPWPSSPRQVPFSWRGRLSPALCSFAWGVGLGVGFLTQIRSFSYYVMIGIVVVGGSMVVAAACALPYALARAAPVVAAAVTPVPPEQFVAKSETWAPGVRLLDALVMLVSSALLVGLAFDLPT